MEVGTTPVEEELQGAKGQVFALSAKGGDITVELDEHGSGFAEIESSPILDGTTRPFAVNAATDSCPIRLTSTADGTSVILNPVDGSWISWPSMAEAELG